MFEKNQHLKSMQSPIGWYVLEPTYKDRNEHYYEGYLVKDLLKGVGALCFSMGDASGTDFLLKSLLQSIALEIEGPDRLSAKMTSYILWLSKSNSFLSWLCQDLKKPKWLYFYYDANTIFVICSWCQDDLFFTMLEPNWHAFYQ